jgi:hypothetical protein
MHTASPKHKIQSSGESRHAATFQASIMLPFIALIKKKFEFYPMKKAGSSRTDQFRKPSPLSLSKPARIV